MVFRHRLSNRDSSAALARIIIFHIGDTCAVSAIDIFSIIAIVVIGATLAYTYFRKAMLSHTLLLANVAVFLLASATGFYFDANYSVVQQELMFRPVYMMTGEAPYTAFTYMFLHGGFFHLLMNMLALIFLGAIFEEKVGTRAYAIIYFISGMGSAIIYSLVEWGSSSGLVGASGAIFGMLGALAMLYPREKIQLLFFPFPMTMFTVVAIFVLFELFALFTMSGDLIAHAGHLGGFLVGVALAKPAAALGKKNPAGKKADVHGLSALASTPQLKEMLARIEKEDEQEIKDAWIEEFLKKATCPKCGKRFSTVTKGRAKCDCGLDVRAY